MMPYLKACPRALPFHKPVTFFLSYLTLVLYLAIEVALNITDTENAEPLKTYL